MAEWTGLRPAQFDRALAGKREPQPGLFGRSQAQQLTGQLDLLGDSPDETSDPAGSDCLEYQL